MSIMELNMYLREVFYPKFKHISDNKYKFTGTDD